MYGDAGGFMSHLSHSDRVRVKKLAAKRGLTLEGLLQSGPSALKERSPAYLRKQAIKTVSGAYAPAVSQLNDRESQINALDAKRQLDNKFYRDWLAGQQAKADAVSQASDAQLLAATGAAHDAVAQRYAAAGQGLQAQDAATPGNVSNPAQSTATLNASKDKAVGAADIANAAAVGQVARSGTERSALQAANFAQFAALESKRMADTYKALAQVASDKHSTQLQEAADTTKEIARLLDQEVSKAQSNENFQALTNKLGLQQDQFKETVRHDKQNEAAARGRNRHQAAVDRLRKMENDRQFKLDSQKFGFQQAKDNYQRKHKTGPYKTPAGAKSNPKTDANLQKTTRQGLKDIQQAAAIANQPTYKGNYKKYRAHLLAQGINISLINAGWQYAHGGVVPGTVKNLRAEGVVVPKDWRQ